jgi:hypothetical protein
LVFYSVSGNPLAINFLIYRPGSEVRIPIKYLNEEDCVDLKRGAFIVPVTRFLSVTIAPGVDIPPSIDIDVTHFTRMKVITLADIVLPPGVEVHRKVNKNIYVCGAIKGTNRQ